MKVRWLDSTPDGQALSTAAGLTMLDPDREVVVSSCDHGIVLDPQAWTSFRADPKCDAAIFTVTEYPGAARRPAAYAFVETHGAEKFPLVANVSVKVPISQTPLRDRVLVGTFWFRRAGLIQELVDLLVKRDVRVNGELYLDSVFNLLIERKHAVRAIALDGYIGWGDPDAMSEALYYRDCFMGHGTAQRSRLPGVS